MTITTKIAHGLPNNVQTKRYFHDNGDIALTGSFVAVAVLNSADYDHVLIRIRNNGTLTAIQARILASFRVTPADDYSAPTWLNALSTESFDEPVTIDAGEDLLLNFTIPYARYAILLRDTNTPVSSVTIDGVMSVT